MNSKYKYILKTIIKKKLSLHPRYKVWWIIKTIFFVQESFKSSIEKKNHFIIKDLVDLDKHIILNTWEKYIKTNIKWNFKFNNTRMLLNNYV